MVLPTRMTLELPELQRTLLALEEGTVVARREVVLPIATLTELLLRVSGLITVMVA